MLNCRNYYLLPKSMQHFYVPIFTTNVLFLDVKFVINYDFPGSVEDYVHRIGHTGHAGASGTTITFFTTENSHSSKDLQHILVDAKQEVPPQLEEMARYSSHSSGRWGGGRGCGSGFGGCGRGGGSYGGRGGGGYGDNGYGSSQSLSYGGSGGGSGGYRNSYSRDRDSSYSRQAPSNGNGW
ncbi:ATP-dependent RNA helicase dbp2 [Coemansia sp. RSA 1199]|nr:ATP-dependent RNA helicase dbp2 [Coemansia sp. RSA 1199]